MNKLRSPLAPLLLAIPTVLAAALIPTPALATVCSLGTTEHKINGGYERSRGVPNYDQFSFQPGVGDCSPTAVAMVLGYWDANGWSCLFPGTGPYTSGQAPHASITGAVDHFKINLDYSSGFGTWHTPFHPWAGEIADYVAQQDPGAAAWSVHDDFFLSDWDMTSEIDANRPAIINVLGVSGKQFHWDSPSNPSLSHHHLNHSMAVVGFRRVVEGAWFLGGCHDWLEADEFYVSVRSGWQNGGDSELYYHWGTIDIRSAVKVQPGGSPTCSGGTITPCPYTNDGECDEPEGLGWCDEGTDVNDCTCIWRYDGECDEPQGTAVCPAFSDAADC